MYDDFEFDESIFDEETVKQLIEIFSNEKDDDSNIVQAIQYDNYPPGYINNSKKKQKFVVDLTEDVDPKELILFEHEITEAIPALKNFNFIVARHNDCEEISLNK